MLSFLTTAHGRVQSRVGPATMGTEKRGYSRVKVPYFNLRISITVPSCFWFHIWVPGRIVTFTCRDFSGAFGRVLTTKMAPQCRAFTVALHPRRSRRAFKVTVKKNSKKKKKRFLNLESNFKQAKLWRHVASSGCKMCLTISLSSTGVLEESKWHVLSFKSDIVIDQLFTEKLGLRSLHHMVSGFGLEEVVRSGPWTCPSASVRWQRIHCQRSSAGFPRDIYWWAPSVVSTDVLVWAWRSIVRFRGGGGGRGVSWESFWYVDTNERPNISKPTPFIYLFTEFWLIIFNRSKICTGN